MTYINEEKITRMLASLDRIEEHFKALQEDYEHLQAKIKELEWELELKDATIQGMQDVIDILNKEVPLPNYNYAEGM